MRERPGVDDVDTDRAWPESRGLGSSRTRVTAFSLSIAAHVVAILLYTSFMSVLEPAGPAFVIETDTDREEGVVVIELIELDEEDERPEEPEEVASVQPSAADARPPTIGGPPTAELVPPGPSAAERLRPNLVDGRIWAEPPPEFYQLSTEEREELLLSRRIVAWYDSVSLARAAEDRLTDWTFTDSKGGRWGVADGRIYLGDIAIPVPIQFGTPTGQRDAVNYRLWEFEEIQRQSQRYLIEQSWLERSEAIRERRDRERSTEIRPDTTRSR